MIRLIGRRLIIPRGDTGSFTIPVLSKSESDSIGVFTIFNPVTKTRVFQKQVEVQGDVFNIEFNHGETVNLLAGDYLWDIKFYINPIIEDNKVIDGTEVDSYYAAFQIPKCEIRETGDDFMVIEGQPAKIEDLNIILAATAAANAAKIAATEKAEEAAARLAEMVAAIPTKVSELENDSGYLQEETDPTVPDWAKAPTKPSYTPQEVGALPADTFIPSKVSDLTDDSGHYIKPVNGIPASDLEETYLTQHQDISMKANSADLAAVATSGDYSDLDNTPYIPTKTSDLVNDSSYPIDANYIHTDNNYTTAEKEKLAGIAAGAEVNVNADWDATSGDAQILNKPTKVSDFQNDAGYLTQHQDISGKANAADLATVATSGSYNDLEDKPFIPSKVSDLTDDSGHYTKPAGGIPASDLAETYLTAHQDISGKADKSEIPTKVSQLQNDSGYLTSFTETDPTVPAWAKAAQKPSYTAAEVGAPTVQEMNTAIGNAIGNINSFDMAVVQELPTQDISTHTIYLVPKTGETNDVYDEYIYINNAWEMVGNTQIDLNNYALKSEIPEVPVQDVQVNGTSIVENGAANVPILNEYGKYGLPKIISDDSFIISNGSLRLNSAVASQIKAGTSTYRAIAPILQHASVFYGLAKAAGDTTQSQSSNAVGTYTTEAKVAINTMIGSVSKESLKNAGISAQTYTEKFNGEFTVTTATTNDWLSPYARASVTGRISKHYMHRVTFNGTEYILPTRLWYNAYSTGIKVYEYLGNLGLYISDISGVPEGTDNVPFVIISDLNDSNSIDVLTQTAGTYTILVEQINNTQIELPKSLIWKDSYVPIKKNNNGGTYNGYSIGVNELLNTRATGAIGYGNKISSEFSYAIGTLNEIIGSGDKNYTIGYKNTVYSGTAIGMENTVNSGYAIGNVNDLSGGIGIGYGLKTNGSEVALGQYNVMPNEIDYINWQSNTEYHIGDHVLAKPIPQLPAPARFVCLVDHTSSSAFSTDYQANKWKVTDETSDTLFLIGIGNATERKNGLKIDTLGHSYFYNDIYIKCEADSTGGAKVLCEADFATAQDIQNIINGGAGA